jgi:protein TonB
VLAAGGILLGAAALQSVLITVPGPGSSNPHAITVDTNPPVAAPKPWDEPSKSPTMVMPAEPADPAPTGAVPDAPQSADHAVDPAAPASPAEADSVSEEAATEPAKPVADEPKIETPPAELKPAPKPEPSQIAKGEPETVAPPVPSVAAAPKPMPEAEPAQAAEAPEETLEAVVKAPDVPDAKPVEEAKVETLPEETSAAAQPEPAEVAASEANEARPEAEKAPEAPKVTEAAAEATSPEPEPAPVAKASPREEKPAPKSTPAEKSRETAAAKAQGGLFGKPMALGFGRKTAPAAGRVSSGRYAANVRAAIGRHRPRVGGGGSATVAFSIGPGGGLQGVKIVRSSGRQAADQAAVATVRAAAPFPPPPAGVNNNFSIQIYFR